MPRLRPTAFFSYPHFNNAIDANYLVGLCERITLEYKALTNDDLEVFIDTRNLRDIKAWKSGLKDGLREASILIAVITPSYLRSKWCRSEYRHFMNRERKVGRKDLIFPIYYLELTPNHRAVDSFAQDILGRRHLNWLDKRREPLDSPAIVRAISAEVLRMAMAIEGAKSEDNLGSSPISSRSALPTNQQAMIARAKEVYVVRQVVEALEKFHSLTDKQVFNEFTLESKRKLPPNLKCAAICPNGLWIASGHERNLRIWDANGFSEVASTSAQNYAVLAATFSPSGQQVAYTGKEWSSIHIWNFHDRQAIKLDQLHKARIKCLAFSPDESCFATGGDDQVVNIWALPWGHPNQCSIRFDFPITAVAFRSDSTRVLVGTSDGSVFVWHKNEGRRREQLLGHRKAITSVGYSDDGTRIATVSHDGTARIWDALNNKLVYILEQGTDITSAAFSPDSMILATGRVDGAVTLWSVAKGEPLQTLTGPQEAIRVVFFWPDGVRLAALTEGGSAFFWRSPVRL